MSTEPTICVIVAVALLVTTSGTINIGFAQQRFCIPPSSPIGLIDTQLIKTGKLGMLTTDNKTLSAEIKGATENLTNSLCRQGEISTEIMNTTTTPPKTTASTIPGTNITLVRNSQGSIDKYDRLVNIAKLHGNLTDDYNNMLRSQQNVLSCVNNLLDNVTYLLSGCDDSLTNAVVRHSLGDNQTIIKMAKEYLKARGIQ